jgi:pimeloyl-ACP methyl ester carboxylesterase
MKYPYRKASLILALATSGLTFTRSLSAQRSQVVRIPSKDGTLIAVECIGSGPTLLIVHGGIGDRTRWTPMFPLLSSSFKVCAMDRRGHGESGDSKDYSFRREAEDVAAVVNSRRGTVYLLGHSLGGLAALEATFLTKNVAKLLLYEPPLQDRVETAVIEKIEAFIQAGNRDEAVATFLRETVKVPPAQITAMRSGAQWSMLIKSIDTHPRQMRALGAYRFPGARVRAMTVPTLIIRGSDTKTPDVLLALDSLRAALPNQTETVLKGQTHYAMDTGREGLAAAIKEFLLSK